MTIHKSKLRKLPLAIASASAALCMSSQVAAQAQAETNTQEQSSTGAIEEITVLGRLKSGAAAIISERIEQAYSAEILGFEQITRVGDSNIAAALRRVTGLTLIDGKYIYVRGLGERYSSAQLNGAAVPSPDLTRNVIPLDLFPTSIVETVKVQKAYSSDMPAAFGGGNIDIRTKSIPEGPVFDIAVGTGWNSESSDDGLSPVGDGGDLPGEILNAINTYQGDIGVSRIASFLDTDNNGPSAAELEQAATINRSLLVTLDRDIEIREESLDPDLAGSLSLGNSWDFSDDLVFGAAANVSYDQKLRNENQKRLGIGNPDTVFSDIRSTVESTRLTGALNFGLTYREDHRVETNSYLIRNDEDEARIFRGHDSNNSFADGRQKLRYTTRLEERELVVNQVIGKHSFEDLSFAHLPKFLSNIDVNWYYSDAQAATDIPNETNVQALNRLDPTTGEVLSTRLLATASVAQFSFLELEDSVEDYGMSFSIPFTSGDFAGSISGGFSDIRKTREYYGYTVNINAIGAQEDVLSGTPGQVLTNENLLNPNNRFTASLGTGFGKESYIAAQLTDTLYGGFDVNWRETWRLSAGLRWEDFRQATVPVDLLDFTGVSIEELNEALQEPGQKIAIRDDDIYPAIAMTYIGNDLLGAEDYQVRLGYGRTVVRPDLREIADVQFLDPALRVRVQGNPNLEFSEIDHIDLRTELFYSNGDNFTVSLFYKDISQPIERVQLTASEDDILFGFLNAESGEVYGIEFEGLKDIGYGLFVSGNLTLSDSEITVEGADTSFLTNSTRRMTGHSEYAFNAQLGYDSEDNYHTISLVYNAFGERIFYAGRDENDDAFEQPFHSLDLVYSFYPTESATLKLKVNNLLNQSQEFEQKNSEGRTVKIIEKEVGTSISADVKWSF